MTSEPKYRRILLKLSGEALGGARAYGLDLTVVQRIAREVNDVHALGVAVALLVGGGNIFRGAEGSEIGFDRSTGDYMGMLATVINALALQEGVEQIGLEARTMSAIEMPKVAEPFIRRRAMRHLEKGRIVILAGGTGNPFMSTDTAAALRAAELECEVVMKATRVDGVYTADPERDPDAEKIGRLEYLEVLTRGLGVMDSTAVTLCSENQIPIVVFDLLKEGNMVRVVNGEAIGTLIGGAAAR
jgi:uridylate kinase